MILGEMIKQRIVEDTFIIERCILFVTESVQLRLGVLELQLLLRLGCSRHLHDLVELVETRLGLLLVCFYFFRVFLCVDHIVN